VGIDSRSAWRPRPVAGPDGELTWSGNGHALVPGQQLGMSVHFAEHSGTWALLYEYLFALGEDGGVLFQDAGSCAEPPPVDAEGGSLEELAGRIAGCTMTPEAEARRAIAESWLEPTRDPQHYLAAYCSRAPDPPEEMCESDDDCAD